MLTVGSCFSGIGGIELGLERTGGFKTVWQIENDPYASAVLKKHWPSVKRYGDIRSVDPTGLKRVDLICGGYPCQPFSLAGARGGETDERHLWPEMLRLIRGVRPQLVLLENVPGHFSLGFGRVLGDLAESGFDAEWDCIPASSVGAPHQRDRVFIVAYTDRYGWREKRTREFVMASGEVANTPGQRERATQQPRRRNGIESGCEILADAEYRTSRSWGKTERAHLEFAGRCREWASEPDVGRVAHGVPCRVDRLRCLGNAVVPQVAEKVGRMILEFARRQS